MTWKDNLIFTSCAKIDLELNDKGEWKKKPRGMDFEWQNLTESKINKKHKVIAVLTGEKSNITVLDFDSVKVYDDYASKFGDVITQCPRVKTRRGYHVYFSYSDYKLTRSSRSRSSKIDIQGNGKLVYYPETEYRCENGENFVYSWENESDTLTELPKEIIQELNKDNEIKSKPIENIKTDTIDCHPELKEIIENIDIQYIDDYTSWTHIVFSLYKVGQLKEVAREISMKSKKYDKTHREFEQLWESAPRYPFTEGTLRHYSRVSNPDKYRRICCIYQNIENKDTFSEVDLRDYFLKVQGDNIVAHKKQKDFKVFYQNKWQREEGDSIISHLLMTEVQKLFATLHDSALLDYKNDPTSDSKSKKLKTIATAHTSYGAQKNKNVLSLVKDFLRAHALEIDIFDESRNLFAFTNATYNLATNSWVEASKWDYILTTCNKEYTKPTEAHMQTIDTVYKDIFPDEKLRKAHLSFLRNGLWGMRDENFIICTGTGRNGKGVLHENFMYLLGDYGATGHLCLLTGKVKEGANTELRSLHKKRFTLWSEPEDGFSEKIRMSNIKAFTGNEQHKARGLYDKDDDTRLYATMGMEANNLPAMAGRVQNAEIERLRQIDFNTEFTNDPDKLKSDSVKYKPMNTRLKEPEFKKEHYCALFNYIIENTTGNHLYMPDVCKQAALNYLKSNDEFAMWFLDNFEQSKDSIVSVKDILQYYKSSDYYHNLPNGEKRMITETNFKTTLRKNIVIGRCYKERDQYYNGKRITRDSVVGYTYKNQNADSDCEVG